MDEADARKIAIEHAVKFEKIKGAGLDVSAELEYAGWTNFFSIRESIYPHRLKELWRTSGTASTMFVYNITGNVNVVRHRFDLKDLEEATGCAMTCASFTDEWEDSERRQDVSVTLSGSPYVEIKAAQDLMPKARFLHLLLTRCVTPRRGQVNVITKQDKFVLYHLMQFRKVNINDLIFHHMLKIVKQSTKTCYP